MDIGYRVYTGFRARGSAADVVRYETEELGNDLELPVSLEYLETYPASDLIWVTATPEDALRYGSDVDEIPLNPENTVIGTDGDGGYLVLNWRPNG